MTTSMQGGRLAGRGIEQKGKRTHGHGQWYGYCWGYSGIRGVNGNGKYYNKDKTTTTKPI